MTATAVTEPTNTVVKDKPTVHEQKPVITEASETTEAPAPQEEAKDASKTETVADVAPEPESPTEAITEAVKESSTEEEEENLEVPFQMMPLTEEEYTSLVNARNTLAANGGLVSNLLSLANDCGEALNDEDREELRRGTEGLQNCEEYINALLKEHESIVAKQQKETRDLLDTIENGDLLQLSEEEVENLDPTQKEIYSISKAYHSVPDEVKRAYDLLFPN
ncbi:predicted protein [Chaetoceros tenuissimus]|uniref:Uncharacterized protein n=1 Tax=Chaetoceros tenuissimus TaxID=426638 RepID=A0AAD3CHF4_9STRA|nr:predicted protein [Chaetoceros tenuissimus]